MLMSEKTDGTYQSKFSCKAYYSLFLTPLVQLRI